MRPARPPTSVTLQKLDPSEPISLVKLGITGRLLIEEKSVVCRIGKFSGDNVAPRSAPIGVIGQPLKVGRIQWSRNGNPALRRNVRGSNSSRHDLLPHAREISIVLAEVKTALSGITMGG